MKRSVLYIIASVFLAAALCVGILTASFMPRARASLFVKFNGDKLEQAIKSDGGIPVRIGYTSYNIWAGGGMTEFILFSFGSSYYGCYYSGGGAPYVFQNAGAELIKTGENRWEWSADGNRGETSRIRGNWYYFEAKF